MALINKFSKYILYNNFLCHIGCKYTLLWVFNCLPAGRLLKIIKYNKSIQKRTDININHYKVYSEKYSPIELDIVPMKDKYSDFININEKNKKYFHIYFNDNKEKEIENTSLNKDDNVSKISIIIDYQIKSFSKLFAYCESIESIKFKKFYRNNVTNMSGMFRGCSSLKELNLNNFNTNKVTDMSEMFCGCSLLKELNLNNFNTNKVTNMNCMFCRCSSLKELNLNNFNTNNVTDMSCMFIGCSSLKELNLSNFNTNNVTDMRNMFYECSSLKELNLNNFNTDNVTDTSCMFYGCPDEIKIKIGGKIKNPKRWVRWEA